MSKARPITEAEFKRTLAVARATRHPERNVLCLMLSARAGMRVGEIGGLDLADAYDEHAGAVRDRIYMSAERTKWAHAREVHLNQTVRRELVAYLKVRGTATGALMLTQSGKRFGRTALVGLFAGLYQRAGIETSSHAGRALFITSLADKGVSLRIVQKAVGHKSLSATNHYFSARPAEVSAAAVAVSAPKHVSFSRGSVARQGGGTMHRVLPTPIRSSDSASCLSETSYKANMSMRLAPL